MTRGQILERMTVVWHAEANVALEALWQPGVTAGIAGMPVIIAGHHPRLGGNMDGPACSEIVWQLARRGHPTLRFNWRGVGASSGTSTVPWLPDESLPHLHEEIADLTCAIDHQAAGAPCVLVGVSFGAGPAAALAARHPLVQQLVLVAPPVGLLPFDLDALAASAVSVGIVAAEQDTTTSLALIQREVAGRFRIEVIAGANQGFAAGLVELGRTVAGFLAGHEQNGS